MCSASTPVSSAISSIGFSVETPVLTSAMRVTPCAVKLAISSRSTALKVSAVRCWLPANEVNAG